MVNGFKKRKSSHTRAAKVTAAVDASTTAVHTADGSKNITCILLVTGKITTHSGLPLLISKRESTSNNMTSASPVELSGLSTYCEKQSSTLLVLRERTTSPNKDPVFKLLVHRVMSSYSFQGE